MIKRIFNSNFFKGSLIFSLSSFGVSFLNYLFNLIIAKGYSLGNYGEYMSAMSYVALLSVPLTAFNLIVIKKIGNVELTQRKQYILDLESWFFSFLKNNFLLEFSLALLSFIFLLKFSNLSFISLIFIYLAIALNIYSNFYSAAFQSLKSFFLIGVLNGLASLFKILVALFIVKFSATTLALYIIILFSFLLVILFSKIILYKNLVRTNLFKINLQPITYYLKNKLVLNAIFSGIGSMGILNIDLILVKKFFLVEEAGLYAALSLLAKIIFYLATPIVSVAYTFFTGKESQKKSGKILLLSLFFLGLIMGGSLFIYSAFPQFIINLFFDQRYLVLTPYLWLAAVFGGFYSMMVIFLNYHIAKEHAVSALALVAILVQILGISIFHQSFLYVLTINIVVVSCLLAIFGLRFLIEIRNHKKYES